MKVAFVLWVLRYGTHSPSWIPLEVATTLQQCKAMATTENITDAHNIVDKWKCVRYRIDE
jgi:hypothetical protein